MYTSEEVRDRERENFRHFLDYNRLLAGAVSHEIRNLCSAISVVCSNLNRQVNLNDNADFQALNSLVAGLSRLASFDLRNRAGVQTSVVDIKPGLDEFRVIVEPDWLDIEGSVAVTLPDWFPKVHCDPHGLLQVFLNLAQNALRSAGSVPAPSGRSLEVRGSMRNNQAIISFVDAGPGIQDPDKLFKPFHPGAEGSGLGLYVSRTILRSFGGDLVFVPTEAGCRFEVVLIPSAPPRRPTEVNSGSSNEADPVVHPG